MADTTSFAALLRRYRLAAGLSQETLAERAGLTAQAVGALERGQRRAPYRDTVQALAEALGLDAAGREALARAVPRARAQSTGVLAPAQAPTARATPHHPDLPFPPDVLIGREGAVGEVAALLRRDDVQLLTLLGPGGVGKTRLALEAARVAAPHFGDGVRFVPLAAVTDHRLVASAIALALGAQEPSAEHPADDLRAVIGERPLLLVLDNFEQVTPATALLADLLADCPRLTLLVTSRAALRARGERRYPVPPLALPPPDAPALPTTLAAIPAVALFVRRTREADPGFALTAENAAAIAAICRRLDGLPLALELAAVRLTLLSPAGLLARLERALPLLTGGGRDRPERHQTLRATLAWSYELLASGEQIVLRRLAPFAGGCTLAAAAAVCGTDEALEIELLDWLGALIEQSLLRREAGHDGEPRFAMLETVREFAAERLAAHGEAASTHRQHAAYFLALAIEAEPTLQSPAPGAALERLEREHDNLRAALAWLLAQPGEGTRALRLAAALWRFWLMRGHASQGRDWLGRALAAPGADADTAARAKALSGASALAHSQGDYAAAAEGGAASLALWRRLDDPAGIAGALGLLALARRGQGEYAAATALGTEALTIWRALGEHQRSAATLTNLSALANDQGEYARAEGYLTESLALKRALGDTQGVAIALHNLAECARYQDDNARAAALLTESLALFRALGGRPRIAHALQSLGMLELARQEHERAALLLRESLDLFLALDERAGAILCLEGLAQHADARRDHARAARLLGCVAAQREALGFARAPVDRAAFDATLGRAEVALGAPAFAAAWTIGRGLTLADAALLAAR